MKRLFAWIRGWVSREFEDPRRVITPAEIMRIERVAKANNEKWTELTVGLSKWIFATLITIGTGGVYLSITLGFHPDAVQESLWYFFGGILCSIFAATSIIYAISQKFGLADLVSSSHDQDKILVYDDEIKSFFKYENGYLLAAVFVLASIFLIFLGGGALFGGMRLCSQSDFDFSVEYGQAVAPAGKGQLRDCYYYEIERLSSDPLIRAQQEIDLIKHAEDTGYYAEDVTPPPE